MLFNNAILNDFQTESEICNEKLEVVTQIKPPGVIKQMT